MPTPKQLYTAAINDTIKRYQSLEVAAVRGIIAQLQQLRKDIAADILNAPDFTASHLTRLKQELDTSIGRFELEISGAIRDDITRAYYTGIASVTEPLGAIGYTVAPLNRALLNTLLDFSSVLVQNITGDMRARIDAQLRLSALGARTPFETMRYITDILGVTAKDGTWAKRPDVVRGVAVRAETITRTELTRIQNIARHQQQLEAADIVPGLTKRWLATGDSRTRPAHLQAHIETMVEPIPVDQPFIVDGEALMFPGDPAGSAANTANCRCSETMVVAEIGVVKTSLDKNVDAQEKERDAKTTG
jgi:hypothetical protein